MRTSISCIVAQASSAVPYKLLGVFRVCEVPGGIVSDPYLEEFPPLSTSSSVYKDESWSSYYYVVGKESLGG